MTDDASLRLAYARLVASPRADARSACPSGEALLAVVERAGPEEARLATMEHVMQCAACQRDLDLLRAALVAATEAGAAGAGAATVRPLGRRPRFPMRTFAAAAGIVVVVGVGAIVRIRGDGADAPDTPRLRSAGRPQLTLVPPVTTADGSVLLQWRSVPNTVQYRVDVFDAAGRSVTTATVPETTFTLGAAALRGDSLRYVVTAVQADAGEVTSVPGPVRP